jgi:hypothetical protein
MWNKFLQNLETATKPILLGYSHAVAWLKMSGARLSLRRLGFDSKPLHVDSMIELAKMGNNFLQVVLFSPVSIKGPMLPMQISFISNWHYIILPINTIIIYFHLWR